MYVSISDSHNINGKMLSNPIGLIETGNWDRKKTRSKTPSNSRGDCGGVCVGLSVCVIWTINTMGRKRLDGGKKKQKKKTTTLTQGPAHDPFFRDRSYSCPLCPFGCPSFSVWVSKAFICGYQPRETVRKNRTCRGSNGRATQGKRAVSGGDW